MTAPTKKRVLVVDDSGVDRMLIAHILGQIRGSRSSAPRAARRNASSFTSVCTPTRL